MRNTGTLSTAYSLLLAGFTMCKGVRQRCWAVILLAVLQVVDAQPQTCIDALNAADINNDDLIVKAEYINLMADLSPYQGCPVFADFERFFGLGPFSLAFEGLSCLCLQYSTDPNCCSGTTKGLAVPGVNAAEYTNRLCTSLYDTLALECGDFPLAATPVPTSLIIPVTDAPSAAPISFNEKGLSTEGDDDDKNLAKIVTPIVLGFFIFVLAIFLLVKSHGRFSSKDKGKEDFEGDDENNDLAANDPTADDPTDRAEDP